MHDAEGQAHPRVCGENEVLTNLPCPRLGSSPRVRGKRFPRSPRQGAPRLIPACAGKTVPQRSRRNVNGAHPRVCGENRIAAGRVLAILGSSPRVRGKQSDACASRFWQRLIPACAGKTTPRESRSKPRSAHPRVCGENVQCDSAGLSRNGSSPRVRGKLNTNQCAGLDSGLIPACAGKTLKPRL